MFISKRTFIKSRSFWIGLVPYFRINDHLNLRLEFNYENHENELGYVDQNPDLQAIYFGKRNRETTVNTLETSYIFNSKLTLTFRLRHYHSKAVYDSYYQLQQTGELDSSTYLSNHNVNYNAFNIDFTMRWNFAPGSEIFLNWKNVIYTSDQLTGQNYWQNLATTLEEPHMNSISLKVIYYFDM